MSDKYICSLCRGTKLVEYWGPSGPAEPCGACNETGREQITIPLEEYDRLKKRCVDSGDYCQGCSRETAWIKFGGEQDELKQRREQDLTLEMVEFLKNRVCGNIPCGRCSKKEICDKADDWLNEQEARLKEVGQ